MEIKGIVAENGNQGMRIGKGELREGGEEKGN